MLSERESIADLCSAIILQAVDDYREMSRKIRCRKCKDKRERMLVDRELRSIELFFRSDWFRMITNLDGVTILKELRANPSAGAAV